MLAWLSTPSFWSIRYCKFELLVFIKNTLFHIHSFSKGGNTIQVEICLLNLAITFSSCIIFFLLFSLFNFQFWGGFLALLIYIYISYFSYKFLYNFFSYFLFFFFLEDRVWGAWRKAFSGLPSQSPIHFTPQLTCWIQSLTPTRIKWTVRALSRPLRAGPWKQGVGFVQGELSGQAMAGGLGWAGEGAGWGQWE